MLKWVFKFMKFCFSFNSRWIIRDNLNDIYHHKYQFFFFVNTSKIFYVFVNTYYTDVRLTIFLQTNSMMDSGLHGQPPHRSLVFCDSVYKMLLIVMPKLIEISLKPSTELTLCNPLKNFVSFRVWGASLVMVSFLLIK